MYVMIHIRQWDTMKDKTILDTIVESGEFITLTRALGLANMAKILNGKGPFTLFAPTDEAFEALGGDLVEEILDDPEMLDEVLLYHIASDTYTSKTMWDHISELEDTVSITTAQGEPLMVRVNTGLGVEDIVITVNGATVEEEDIRCSNGIIHVVNTVLFPPSLYNHPCIGASKETREKEGPQRTSSATPKFEIYNDKIGRFRFRLKSGEGMVIAVGEGFATKQECLDAIERIKTNANSADIIDLT
ncbi:MAG TPA: DUF1508 domain-containing protein [Methanomicrobia archaeon]|nr:DUF1508 domain-containing protein [Methanomicrobia archaeon]